MPGFKVAKDMLTLFLGANSAGDRKLKWLLVYHSESPLAFKDLSRATLPGHFRSNPKAWMAIALSENWFMNCFIPKVEKFCTGKDIPFHILLIIGNAPGHNTHLDNFHTNINVVFLPPKTTSILQPMNQSVIANLNSITYKEQAVEVRDTGKISKHC
jgi:hypothetical protein